MHAAAGSSGPGQVVIGDERGDAELARARHAFDAGDAVVDGDEEIGPALRGELDQLGREPVAELEAVGHEVLRVRAKGTQRADADRAGGGAVGVVVGDDEEALARLDGVGEEPRRVVNAFQKRWAKARRRLRISSSALERMRRAA